MIEIKKVTMEEDIVKQLIELSYVWEKEDITFGLIPNERSDLKEPCYAALEGNRIVGYTFGHFYEEEKKYGDIEIGDKCFMIDELYVIREYRSQGIGRKLFKAMEEEVKDQVKFVTLATSTKDYLRILHFYHDDVDMTFHNAFLYKRMK